MSNKADLKINIARTLTSFICCDSYEMADKRKAIEHRCIGQKGGSYSWVDGAE